MDQTYVIPRPKYLRLHKGSFKLSQDTPLVNDPEFEKETKILRSLLREGTGVACRIAPAQRDKRIELRKVLNLPDIEAKEEGYKILVKPDKVALEACTHKGIFYSCQSLFDLVKRDGDGWAIPCCEVRDWPDFRFRGFMADPARHFYSLEHLEWEVDNLARNKYNYFHLHLSDTKAFRLPTKRYPKLNIPPDGAHKFYTRSEIRDLCSYAAERKIEVIPEIELPAHADYLIRQYPELKCKVAHGKVSERAICIGAESTYEFLENLLDEIVPLFPGKLFHIGTDELEFKDKPDRVFVSWRECSECQRRMKNEGLKNHRELLYYFVRRVRNILASHGKRTMMWNDSIDIAKPHTVPHDVLLQFWRIAGKGRGPRRGCSLGKLLEDGFEVVNSFAAYAYLRVQLREKTLVKWHPQNNKVGVERGRAKLHHGSYVPKEHRDKIVGGECPAFLGFGEKDPYVRTLPSAWALFADRVWNKKPVDDPDDFALSLAEHIFGPQVPQEMRDYFHVQGGMAFEGILAKGRKIYAIEPAILKPIPVKERIDMCDKLLQIIRTERRKKKLTNLIVLPEYAKVLKALRRELAQHLVSDQARHA